MSCLENISKCSLDSIPSPSLKIQIIDRKVCLRCKCKTLLGIVSKPLKTKSLLTTLSNVLLLNLKQTFSPIIWIFIEGEGDGIESRLHFKKFPLYMYSWKFLKSFIWLTGFNNQFQKTLWIITNYLTKKQAKNILSVSTLFHSKKYAQYRYESNFEWKGKSQLESVKDSNFRLRTPKKTFSTDQKWTLTFYFMSPTNVSKRATKFWFSGVKLVL